MVRQDMAKVTFARNGQFGIGFGANTRQEVPSSQQDLNSQGLPSHSQPRVTNGCDGVPTGGAAQELPQVLWRTGVWLSSLPLPTALTSALYMRMRPWLTLDQEGTALMFQSWLECSAKGPVFI